MSGAGRSTAANAMEDAGWFVVDNLPPELLAPLVELGRRSQGSVPRIAAVVDVRGRAFFDSLRGALEELDGRGIAPRIMFLEASDDVLVRRFENVRRPHPLQGDARIVDGIAEERELLLRPARPRRPGDRHLATRTCTSCAPKSTAAFGRTAAEAALTMSVVSFGYKYGLPVDADLVVDCRFLPNPHWVPELRPHTGTRPGGQRLRARAGPGRRSSSTATRSC